MPEAAREIFMENKPIQLIIADLKSGLSNVINDAHIPMICITPVIKELYEKCLLIENEQFRQAKDEYEKMFETSNSKDKPENLTGKNTNI